MIKRNQRYFNWMNRLLDMAIIYISYAWAVLLWIFILKNDINNVAVNFVYDPVPVLLTAFGFVVLFQYGGLYDSVRYTKLTGELLNLLKQFLIGVVIVVGLLFLTKIEGFSRGVMITAAVSAYFLLAAKRVATRLVLRTVRRAGYNQKHVLIVGSGGLALEYVRCIHDNPQFGYSCVGYVGAGGAEELGQRLGGYGDLQRLLDQLGPDEVIIAIEQQETGLISGLIECCEQSGIRASIIPAFNDYLPESASVDSIDNIRLINLRTSSQDIEFNRGLKRAFDIVFSLAAITLTSPLMLVIAVGVKLSSPGPVLFKQTRVGRDRKNFQMYKFRSMVVTDRADTTWSKSVDSRITPFGAFIRKFSLDELPQFFNVLRGEMSVVGPRPELPFFVEKYRYEVPRYMVKHYVKPGITGWAQVNGYRGDTSIEKRIEYDLWYIENWSLYLDIRIIVMTVLGGMMNEEKNIGRRKK